MDEDLLPNMKADRYHFRREIGRGATARVYLAEDLRHARRVAIKVFEPHMTSILGPERFRREIEITARLNHPHILPLYDSGEADRRLFFVMPYVEEGSLRSHLGLKGPLGVAEALRIGAEVLAALAYAHAHGFVHRDVKPENILMSTKLAVLSDFGIARLMTAAGGTAWTTTGSILGTPAYMSPEQIQGSLEIDGRSDFYNLGCVIYEMLAGRTPFVGQTIDQVLRQHLTAQPPSIRLIRHELSQEAEDLLARALAKTREERFSSAEEMAEALTEVANGVAPKSAGRRSRGGTDSLRPGRTRWPLAGRLAPWLTGAIGVVALALLVPGPISHDDPVPVRRVGPSDSLSTIDMARTWKPSEARVTSTTRPTHPPAIPGTESSISRPPLQAEARFFRSVRGGREPLDADELIAPTDRLSLDLVGSDTMYVYVLDEDSAGNLYVLFPLADAELRNPLLPRVSYRLPGSAAGKLLSWGVSSSNGDETVLVFAVRHPQRALEEQLAQLPHASSANGFPLLSQAGVQELRGLAALVEESTTSPASAPRISQMLAQFAHQGPRDRDLWTWQIHLRNPGS